MNATNETYIVLCYVPGLRVRGGLWVLKRVVGLKVPIQRNSNEMCVSLVVAYSLRFTPLRVNRIPNFPGL